MHEDAIAARRAQLTGLTGPARTRLLVDLGRLQADAYWRAGPGKPEAKVHLDAAIASLDEVYGYLDPADGVRGRTAALLGWLLSARHMAHGGPAQDRVTGLRVLTEALTFPQLPPVLGQLARLSLGQLHLASVTRALGSAGFAMTAMRPGGPAPEARSADLAADCFRQVLADPQAVSEITRGARAMLTMAEAIQTVLGGLGSGPGGLDVGRMLQAMSVLQKLQQDQAAGTMPAGGGLPPMTSFLDSDRIAAADPLDRPVAVVAGRDPAAAAGTPPGRPVTPPAAPGDLRRELRARIAPTGDLWRAVLALIEAGDAPADFDDLVALASSTVHATGADHIFLAVALWLRSRTGAGDGWGDDSGDGDLEAAAGNLLVAATEVEDPPAVGALLRLAVRLGVLDRIAGAFADAAAALRTIGADGLAYPQSDGTAIVLDPRTGGLSVTEASWPRRCRVVGYGAAPSTVASHRQLVALSRISRLPVTADPVFVATGEGPSTEVLVLRRAFYPRSTGLGQTIEDIDAAGTADDVRRHLTASMLHLDCPIGTDGVLRLAGSTTLAPADLPVSATGRGGVVILPNGDYDFPVVADAYLAAGPLAVIGWRRPVPGPVAALAGFLLHSELADRSREPADAVLTVRAWLAGPGQAMPVHLPPGYASAAGAAPGYADSLAHRGA